MNENEKTVMARLTAPFKLHELKWRPLSSGIKEGKPWIIAAPFVSSQVLMRRLDAVLGVDGWGITYDTHGNSMVCSLKVKIGAEWIVKSGAAGISSEIEPVKTASTSSFKRACSTLGVGRYIAEIEPGFGIISEHGQYKGAAKHKSSGEYSYFKWNPPALPALSEESKLLQQPAAQAKDSAPPVTTPTTPVLPERQAGTSEPTYEDLPMSLKQIFQQVKMSQTKALDLVRRRKYDYVAVEKLLRELMPDIEKQVAA